jgi:hypothetical protein
MSQTFIIERVEIIPYNGYKGYYHKGFKKATDVPDSVVKKLMSALEHDRYADQIQENGFVYQIECLRESWKTMTKEQQINTICQHIEVTESKDAKFQEIYNNFQVFINQLVKFCEEKTPVTLHELPITNQIGDQTKPYYLLTNNVIALSIQEIVGHGGRLGPMMSIASSIAKLYIIGVDSKQIKNICDKCGCVT